MKSYQVFQHQSNFIKSSAKYPALVAGYGSGKTVAFILKALLEAGRNPKKTILLAEPTYPMIRDVLQPTLEETLHKLGFSFTYRASEVKYTIHWKKGWANIILRSAENYRRWAGLNLAGFGIDEAALLKDKKAWNMGLSRLREGKHLCGWITTTPEGFNFVYDLWKDKPLKGYELIQGKTTDNPFLPKDFINSLYENYDNRLISSYIHGNFVNLQYGTTYYSFDRDKNVSDEVNYTSTLPLRIGLDFNVEPMCAVLFQTQNNKPYVKVIDEVIINHSGSQNELMTERMVKTIKAKYNNKKYICYPDPAGKARGTSSRMSDHDILRANGFLVKAKRKAPSVIDSVNAVNNIMKNCVVASRCKEIIKDLEKTVNKDGTREIDKTDKDRTHLTDGFRYAIDIEFPVRKPKVRQL